MRKSLISKSLECAFVTLLACRDNVYKHLFKSLWNIVGTRLSVTAIAPTASGERRPEVFRQSHSLDLLSLIAENIHHRQSFHVPNIHIHPRIHHQCPCRIFSLTCFTWKSKKAISQVASGLYYAITIKTPKDLACCRHRALSFPQFRTPKNPKNRSNLTGQRPRYIKRSQEQLYIRLIGKKERTAGMWKQQCWPDSKSNQTHVASQPTSGM